MSNASLQNDIEVKDRYYKVGHWEVIFLVKRIFVPDNREHIAHVVLEREDSPGDFNVISRSVLEDRKDYRPDRRNKNSVNLEDNRRRRDDQPRNPR
jgi:hypothetical protein